MTVHFYYHTPFPADMNERRAFCRVARLLHERYGRDPADYFLIANIDPRHDTALKKLTQLDALLITPQSVAILDFKSCYAPFDGRDLQVPWPTADGHFLYSGSDQNTNPYQQAEKARRLWSRYLGNKSKDFFGARPENEGDVSWPEAWRHLQSYVLIHPMMHPDAQPPTAKTLEGNHNWFHLHSVDDILVLTYTIVSSHLKLAPVEAEELIRLALYAEPWEDMDELLHAPIGSLFVYEPDRSLMTKPLYSYDEVTIGRTHAMHIRISNQMKQVSGYHARVEVQKGQVMLYDAGSLNGIYVNRQRIDGSQGIKLSPDIKVFLGGKGKNACQVWFEPVKPEEPVPKTRTRLTNETKLALPAHNAKP